MSEVCPVVLVVSSRPDDTSDAPAARRRACFRDRDGVRVSALRLALGWRVLSGIFTEHRVRPMQHERES